jgi:hypothetical protein
MTGRTARQRTVPHVAPHVLALESVFGTEWSAGVRTEEVNDEHERNI